MPLYDYRCQTCGYQADDIYQPLTAQNNHTCPACSSSMRRVLCVNLGPADLPTHHNIATGTIVHNRREFRDALKMKSDEATARTGIEHNYEEVDRRDTAALGVTAEGLDSTARVRHARGLPMQLPD